MPKYRFSWNAFDDRTVRALAEAYGYSGPRENFRPAVGVRGMASACCAPPGAA
ncbi:MAG: hypothetical protein IPG04_01760 [Polyangiaceae bacterium]|nr:hypothetical protein [Polyangiaceae bacterium]